MCERHQFENFRYLRVQFSTIRWSVDRDKKWV